ncbi:MULTISPECIES: hypothetical protein [Methylobacterium]|jgi:proline dehydrogenase|uniref:Uncharacterized protein n=2 Tax=Methylobacterium TaxID=407 RepID=A0AAE8HYK3_9HYPH|nr:MULTISPECIES: hypothetical protein [Methylobacterium]KOX41039.1 hypothetical protein ADL19_31795 [Streptomyces purpurogeneiscleroticus]RUP32243.1 MAG: hypothetical protein EKK45_05995 [Curvibacter sp.]AIQ89269.1 protein of unassigned function [Methylobacterium oryzae CBMB20]APT30174.1 hypothetical protein MCBMB27_00883 [Methylobacterium phyllosphaerae]SFH79947.1 hypothetical protein SAMN05192567_1702 [Methylobacterium phyllosphaerae]
MGDDVAAILLTLATENVELREQLATAQDMLMETAVDAGQLHARIQDLQAECDAWRAEAERLEARALRRA